MLLRARALEAVQVDVEAPSSQVGVLSHTAAMLHLSWIACPCCAVHLARDAELLFQQGAGLLERIAMSDV